MGSPISLLLSILLLSNYLLISHAASSLDVLSGFGMQQLRECAQLGVELSIDDECSTDGCICQPQDLPLILHAVSTAVDQQCSSDIYDATAAMAAVISYCSVRSYPVPPNMGPMTGPPPGNNLPFSLYNTSAYTNLPKCAQIPFIEGCDSLNCHTNNCFCQPGLMKSAMDSVSSIASAACRGIAPAGVTSALTVIMDYCSRNGFAAPTLSGEVTRTTHLPSSSSLSPGAYSSIIQATSSSSVVPSTSDHVSPSFYSPSSSKHLDKIVAPTVIIPLAVIVVAAI